MLRSTVKHRFLEFIGEFLYTLFKEPLFKHSIFSTGPWICIWASFHEYFEVFYHCMKALCFLAYVRTILSIRWIPNLLYFTYRFWYFRCCIEDNTSEQRNLSSTTSFVWKLVSKLQGLSELLMPIYFCLKLVFYIMNPRLFLNLLP